MSQTHRTYWLLLISIILGIISAAGAEKMPGPDVILYTRSYWRIRTVFETEEIIMPSGKIEHVTFSYDGNWFRKNKGKVEVAKGDYKINKASVIRLPENTSLDWMKSDFDDSAWARLKGPFLARTGGNTKATKWKLILMRGRFKVTDPAKAGDLKLDIKFRGGAVVYLNGNEIIRKYMPAGEITPVTASLPYPKEVYLDNNGYLVWPHDDKEIYKDREKKRIREIGSLTIPSSKLKKGSNVLARSKGTPSK